MIKIEVELSDKETAELARGLRAEEFDLILRALSANQELVDRQQDSRLRRVAAIYLFVSSGVVLGVSLALIVAQAFGIAKLPDLGISTLIGSVAAEYVGMLWLVVRYLFGRR